MQANEIREQVSKAYAKAIKTVTPSCCGPQNCCAPGPEAPTAKLASYSPEELKTHETAAANSFGCGNPLAFSGVKKGDVVLDLGSGAGFDLLIAAEKVGPTGRVIGVDMTDAMISKARENIQSAGANNIEVRSGLIEELPIESASVDWVISNCVINLSPEKPKVFREIFRVLKRGGHMRVSDIVVKQIPEELLHVPGLYNSCIAGAISEEEYLAGLAEAGLKEVQVDERFIYEATQLKSMADLEQASLDALFEDMPAEERLVAFGNLVSQMAGNVWSAKFSAKK